MVVGRARMHHSALSCTSLSLNVWPHKHTSHYSIPPQYGQTLKRKICYANEAGFKHRVSPLPDSEDSIFDGETHTAETSVSRHIKGNMLIHVPSFIWLCVPSFQSSFSAHTPLRVHREQPRYQIHCITRHRSLRPHLHDTHQTHRHSNECHASSSGLTHTQAADIPTASLMRAHLRWTGAY